MRTKGYEIRDEPTTDFTPVRAEHPVPAELVSCHSAIVDGYIIEGHVPAEDVERLLAERPPIAGLAVPGMPVGSPGMEVPGRAAEPFDVIAFYEDGRTEVFASH